MKKKKLLLILCVIVLTSLFISGCKIQKMVKLQIVRFDITTGKEKVIKVINVKAEDEVDLEKYRANKIKILEVSDKEIKFLWTKTIYSLDDPNSKSTIDEEETINIDEQFSILNLSPLEGQPRYYYSIRFTK